MRYRPMLELKNISVRLDSFVLEGVNLELGKNDYLALLGVSGAGKTVLLEVLAGLLKPARGEILLNGENITSRRIQNRRIGLVYQDLSLFPHLRVAANIAYPLRNRKYTREKLREKVRQLARETGVEHLLNRYPGTLSGGEGQRVALARTLAADPDILLLDEPLSNLDVKLKTGLRALLRRIHAQGKTVIHVTHDYMEAATLANKVAVIEQGKLIQTGTPDQVFRHPKTEFVARFSGIKNLFRCRIKQSNGQTGMHHAIVGDKLSIGFLADNGKDEGYVMIPQEDIIISESPLETSAVNSYRGLIREVYLCGAGMEVVVEAGAEFVVSVSRQSVEKMELSPGKTVWITFKASAVRFIA
ncbi:MAG: ABC transporter ATP-binding protein [Bacteroidales bacterium]